MIISRPIIRDFIGTHEQGVIWATPQNITHLFCGKYDQTFYLNYAKPEMRKMSLLEYDRENALTAIYKNLNTAYVLRGSSRKALPERNFYFKHNNYLRNILAILYRECGFKGDIQIPTKKFPNKKKADAKFNEFHIEMDMGKKSYADLEKQIKKYANREPGRVIYIFSHSQDREDLEPARLEKARELIPIAFLKTMGGIMKNKILLNTYSDFIKTHKIYNFKGEDKTDLLPYIRAKS